MNYVEEDFMISKILKRLTDESLISEKSSISSVSEGASIASLYYIMNVDGNNFYLKIQKETEYCNRLLKEKMAYELLNEYLIVPEVIFYEIVGDYEVLCISELSGNNFEQLNGFISENEIIRLYAKGLKSIHSLPINICNVNIKIEDRIKQASYRVENNQVNYDDFEQEYKKYTPKELLHILVDKKPIKTDLVLTHGDYCFDNLILTKDNLVGYIDLGNSGIADRYQDIAIAIRSIKHNYGIEYVDLFCAEYGIDRIDYEKMEFYIILDEFS